jgi:hypothetical protein
VRVWSQHGIDLGGAGREMRWPRVAVGGKLVDLSCPDAVARAYACKLFVDVPANGGAIAVEEDGARLELGLDPAQVPHVGIWLNRGGWSPFRRKSSYRNLALEPCLGAPDSLAEALGAWRAAAWLAPGATREWTLVWRGVRTGDV